MPIRIGLVEAGGHAAEALAAGAEAAVAEANARGGVDGRPLQLVKLVSPRPWRDGASMMARLIFDEGLAALIGPLDGAAAHVAAQIATRKRIPLITLSPEAALTRAMDPWVFRGVPGDGEQARALLRWSLPDPRGKRAALVVPDGREGRERLASLLEACRDLGLEATTVIFAGDRRAEAESGASDSTIGAGASSIGIADVLLLWLDPEPALMFLQGLGGGWPPSRILGSMRLDDREYLARVPPWAEGLALPMLRADGVRGRAGSDRGGEPDLNVALGYDMLRALAAAARGTGPEPGQIRDGLASGQSLTGRSGTFHFDRRGNRRGRIPIGILRDGRLVPAHSLSISAR